MLILVSQYVRVCAQRAHPTAMNVTATIRAITATVALCLTTLLCSAMVGYVK